MAVLPVHLGGIDELRVLFFLFYVFFLWNCLLTSLELSGGSNCLPFRLLFVILCFCFFVAINLSKIKKIKTVTAYCGTGLAGPPKSSTCVTLLRARRLLLRRLGLIVIIGVHTSFIVHLGNTCMETRL